MKKHLIFTITLLIFTLLTISSCKKEAQDPFTEHFAFTVPTVEAPGNGQFVNLTGGNTVVLKWKSENGGGDPEKWDVYFGTTANPPLVKEGNSSESYTVTVEKGTKYYWHVEATNSQGIPTRGDLWDFEVVDPAAPLSMDMTWTTNSLDKIGMEIDPLLVANLRLRILKADKTAAVPAINTTDFETYSGFNTLPDGKYYIATDLTSTIDAGDFNNPIDISIDLQFTQRGVMDETFSFPQVMTNQFVCSTYRVYLGYIVKTGTSYVFTKEVTKPVSPYSAVWFGLDNTTDFDYASQVETYMGCSLQIKGLSFEWMSDFWGEVIIKGGSASITIDPNTGAVTIPNQFYCRTKYKGVVQPDYYIEGTGTYDASGAFPTMTITYDLLQNGVSMADQDGGADPKFTAVLTLEPPAASKSMALKTIKMLTRPAIKPAQK